jgi:HNH endonuclease
MSFDTEEWRDIPSIPEYLASSHGRVMRVPFEAPMPYGGWRIYGGKPTKGAVHPKNSMRPLIVFKNRSYRVAHLVCEAFHGPRPSPRAVVMHKDDNPQNNRADNLKWGTQKENLNAPAFIAYCRSRVGENHPRVKDRARQAELLRGAE